MGGDLRGVQGGTLCAALYHFVAQARAGTSLRERGECQTSDVFAKHPRNRVEVDRPRKSKKKSQFLRVSETLRNSCDYGRKYLMTNLGRFPRTALPLKNLM